MRTSALSGCARALTQLRRQTCTAFQDEDAHDGRSARRAQLPELGSCSAATAAGLEREVDREREEQVAGDATRATKDAHDEGGAKRAQRPDPEDVLQQRLQALNERRTSGGGKSA